MAGASSNNNADNTKVSGNTGTDGTINAEADEENANAKKTTNGTIDAEADEDDANAKKMTDCTINADTDDDDADAKNDWWYSAICTTNPAVPMTTNSSAAESDSTQANEVAPGQNVT